MLYQLFTIVYVLASASRVFPSPTAWNQPSGFGPPSSYGPPTLSNCSRNSFTLVLNDDGIWPYRTYQTSNATSPQFLITQNGESIASGSIFLTMANTGLTGNPGVKQQGAIVMSSAGDLVWFGPTGNTSNFRTQTLYNEPVITYWIGSGAAASNGGAAHGYGTVEILNSNYETLYTICPQLDITFPPGEEFQCVADVHESYITERNTMLVTVYNISQADLTSIGGPANGYLLNPLAVEVDIKTSNVLFLWNPQDHVPINSSNQPLQGSGTNTSDPYDWFHMNSIQDYNGGYLINSRQTWTSYFVNAQGQIEWEINGETGGDFGSLPTGGTFSWEHHARLHRYGNDNRQVLYTCFNDANGNPSLKPNASVGVGLVLDLPPSKNSSPRLYTDLVDPKQHPSAYAEGSYTILDNGDYFLGYGIAPFAKEFGPSSPSGADVRWTAQFAYENLNNTASSYRAFKHDWNATPTTQLALVVAESGSNDTLGSCASNSTTRGYVSWNGATDVQSYTLFAGSSSSNLQNTGITFASRGFETEFVVPQGAAFIQVVANVWGSGGGKSAVVAT